MVNYRSYKPYTGESWGWTDVADLNFENLI